MKKLRKSLNSREEIEKKKNLKAHNTEAEQANINNSNLINLSIIPIDIDSLIY